MIVLMAGLPGSGKTALARELANRTAGRVISKDDIRHALFLADEIEYSPRQDDFCVQIMLNLAGELLRKNPERFIFLDGRTFSRAYQIENVVRAATALYQACKIIECVCAEEIIRKRLEEQSVPGAHPALNRNFQLYLDVKARFEAITLPKAIIDTAGPFEKCVQLGLAWVAELER
jgi:predicted kinase